MRERGREIGASSLGLDVAGEERRGEERARGRVWWGENIARGPFLPSHRHSIQAGGPHMEAVSLKTGKDLEASECVGLTVWTLEQIWARPKSDEQDLAEQHASVRVAPESTALGSGRAAHPPPDEAAAGRAAFASVLLAPRRALRASSAAARCASPSAAHGEATFTTCLVCS